MADAKISWIGNEVLAHFGLTNVNVTWVGSEVLNESAADVHVSNIIANVTHDGHADARISWLGLEVLHEYLPTALVHLSWMGLEVLEGHSPVESDYFNPPVHPTIESQVTFNSNPVEAQVDPQLSDARINGIHSVAGTYSLVWNVLLPEQFKVINDFLVLKRGLKPFRYTIPSESTPRTFKCKTWTKDYIGPTYALTAEFREVFDLKVWQVEVLDSTNVAISAVGVEVLHSLD